MRNAIYPKVPIAMQGNEALGTYLAPFWEGSLVAATRTDTGKGSPN